MDAHCNCPCLTWTTLEPKECDAPPSFGAPKAQLEVQKEEMISRYQTPQFEPKPEPRPIMTSPILTSITTRVLASPQGVSPNPSLAALSIPANRLRQQKSLVREDDYGYQMAAFYGEVLRRDTLNTSAYVKSTTLSESSDASFQRNS